MHCQYLLYLPISGKLVRSYVLLLEGLVERLYAVVLLRHVSPDELMAYAQRGHCFLKVTACVSGSVVRPDLQLGTVGFFGDHGIDYEIDCNVSCGTDIKGV